MTREEAIKVIKDNWPDGRVLLKLALEFLIPELKESEDERIRKSIIDLVEKQMPKSENKKWMISWLEKQGEQKPQGKLALEVWKDMRLEVYQQASGNRHEPNYSDDSTKMFSLTDIDEIFEKVAEKQCEQKPTNKIKPRFKVGDTIRPKGSMAEYTIESIYGECYHGKGWRLTIGCDEDYELVEQKPTDEVEPKFKVGDIVRHKNGDTVTITQIDTQHQIYYYKGWDGAATVHSDFSISEQDNWELVEQKPTDKVEPKFKVGDWIVEYNNVNAINQVIKVEQIDDEYFGYTLDDKSYFGGSWESSYRLWTIKDTKAGDVLADDYGIYIFEKFNECDEDSFICIGAYQYSEMVYECEHMLCSTDVHPATKEQRDLLFTKMKEAGYEWNAENKELKKIEKKSTWSEKIKGLNELETYILSLVPDRPLDAIKVDAKNIRHIINKEQNPTWSEEECQIIKDAACLILSSVNTAETKEEEERLDKLADKLQNLRPQPKQEWSEDDEINYESAIWHIEKSCGKNGNVYNWLKSIKERHTWKPSNEQMEALLKLEEMHFLEHEKNQENAHLYMVIKSLKEQLLKLKGE